MIWLDQGATSFRKPPTVAAAMLTALKECASPGRGGHGPAMEAARAVYRCREQAAALFSCDPGQVVFSMNATHGLNMAIGTLVRRNSRVVISGFEHNAVLRPLTALGARITVAGRRLFDPEDTLRAFREAIDKEADCVVCTHVSNVFGYILPVREIGQLCRRRGIPLIVDASQSAGCLPVSLGELGADFIAMPGHKGLYGPQGTGLLLCAKLPEPLLYGGTGSLSQSAAMPDFLPDRGEAGTHNVPGICGLRAGLDFVLEKTPERILRHEILLRRRLASALKHHGFRVFEGAAGTQSGVLSVIEPHTDCEELAETLGQHGVAVRGGLHCAPLAHESAGTLESGTLRLSPSVFTTVAEADAAAHLMVGKNPGKSIK